MDEEIAKQMEELGIIAPSSSPHNSPLHVVPEKEDEEGSVIGYTSPRRSLGHPAIDYDLSGG